MKTEDKLSDERKRQLRSDLYSGATMAARNRDGVNAKAFVEALMMLEPFVPFGMRPAGVDSGEAMPMGIMASSVAIEEHARMVAAPPTERVQYDMKPIWNCGITTGDAIGDFAAARLKAGHPMLGALVLLNVDDFTSWSQSRAVSIGANGMPGFDLNTSCGGVRVAASRELERGTMEIEWVLPAVREPDNAERVPPRG